MNFRYLFAGMALFTTAIGCQHTEKHQEEVISLTVTSPIQVDTILFKEYVCQIRAINHIEVRSQERGYLQKIYVDEGQLIQKGQPMFQIMPMLYEAEVARSKANKDFADIEYQNTKSLSDKKIVSDQELALSKAKVDKEKADLDMAKTHLNLTTIRAPFSGIMDKFQARLGSLLDEGELLTTLSDNSTLWVYFNVPESEYLDYMSRLKEGLKTEVKLRMANNEIYPSTGTLGTIEADFNNETGNIAFRATFPNPDRLLRHGETGMVLVPTVLKNAIIIPQQATYDILDKKFVYIVDAKGVVQSKEIKIKAEVPHAYIVESGLDVHDRILIDGLRRIKSGDEIQASFKPFATVMQELSHLHAE